MAKAHLCMFSGGVDSTAVLHTVLTSPDYIDYDIFVHHISLINRENRSNAELIAVRNIVEYYQRRDDIKEFDYTESMVDLSSLDGRWSRRFSYDMDIVCFIASQLCLGKPHISEVSLGVMRDDFIKAETDERSALRYEKAPGILEAAMYTSMRDLPTVVYPFRDLTKDQLWNIIPNEIRSMAWSCRHPVWVDGVANTCGVCPTCEKRKEVGID